MTKVVPSQPIATSMQENTTKEHAAPGARGNVTTNSSIQTGAQGESLSSLKQSESNFQLAIQPP